MPKAPLTLHACITKLIPLPQPTRMRRAAFNFPAKAAKLSLLFATAGVAGSVSVVAVSDASYGRMTHFSEEIKAAFVGLSRSAYTIFTIASTVIDYKYSLHGLRKGSDEYQQAISEVHLRSAKRILKLCKDNKGFYVKAGQFAASLRQLPKEYTGTLSVLQDQAVPCDFRLIKEVICKNFSCEFDDIFMSFDEEPIAAASIAQVHHAMLKSREEVAVKVQYPGLEQLMKLDITTMSFVSEFVSLIRMDSICIQRSCVCGT
uniref:ABC1 atypical kinase-like domain-containing protein n=1 Tax=Opuntia streptacantha TaxID=393608 RepID=A0A7C9AQW4_OPUST